MSAKDASRKKKTGARGAADAAVNKTISGGKKTAAAGDKGEGAAPTRKSRGKATSKGRSRAAGASGGGTPAAGSSGSPAGKRRGAKLDAKALTSIRAGLEAEKTDLVRRQAELEQDSFDGSQSDMTGELGLDEDYADSGTATFDRERDLSIRNNIQDLIDQTDRAIERIDAGTYGTCERCGRPIEAARLKALHHAVLCLDCKRREERAR